MKLANLYREIQDLYKANDYPWILGYSGGKDSTATVQLVWNALASLPRENLNKEVYILSADTLVEIPHVMNFIDHNLKKMEVAAKAQGLPFQTVKVKPIVSDSFWVNLIGKGYPAPTSEFRWCTDRLKIDPANRFILEKASEYGEAIVVLGLRKSESAQRSKSISQRKINNSRLLRHSSLPNAFVYAPIEDWTVEDVWEFLLEVPSPWGADNKELFEMYKQTNSGECPLVIDSSTPSCGNSRFGCWVCTVVKNEKALSSLIESGETWLIPLARFREKLVETQDPEKKQLYRDYKRRDGTTYFLKGGEEKKLGRGPYLFTFRKELLRELLLTEKELKKVNQNISLIQPEELIEIRRIWIDEEGDWEDSVNKIYKEVYGIPIYSEEDDIGIFDSEDRRDIEVIAKELGLDPRLPIKLFNKTQYYSNFGSKTKLLNELERIFNEEWRGEIQIIVEES